MHRLWGQALFQSLRALAWLKSPLCHNGYGTALFYCFWLPPSRAGLAWLQRQFHAQAAYPHPQSVTLSATRDVSQQPALPTMELLSTMLMP